MRGGMGGGNMNKMMKQMQKMQKDMMKAQEELQEMTFEATAGGGMVKVVANGNKQIVDVEIKEEVVDPDDVDMLQDLIMAATNDVLKQVEEKSNDTMGQFTKGMNLPGGMF
ncbi:YbaB/EbfC family nucleoid-associated protein [Radiobacillus sp. PE A8.2]|uniref:YbaB/EbfC family nucleoid-associated protein n=1 Tax=Radiobacillus sp. PE A8.2 TaxID=3380349 RepID=UPI00388E9B18